MYTSYTDHSGRPPGSGALPAVGGGVADRGSPYRMKQKNCTSKQSEKSNY